MRYIRPLEALSRDDLPLAGGKAANLGELIRMGLPVPPGFCVTTAAYLDFVEAHGLERAIQAAIGSVSDDDADSADRASAAILEAFDAHPLADGPIAREILESYRGMADSAPAAVAVRSSATAEDLVDLSFAGQQDTWLNVVGSDAVLDAVRRCWASLWTARAISYRARNRVSGVGLSLAVAVQSMVASEASGVLFTANPLTGRRAETVIDATFGLGEALVSGLVEPDHYVVEMPAGRIAGKAIGSKAVTTTGKPEGGTRTAETDGARVQALPDEAIIALARLGEKAEAGFGIPQDIEWAYVKSDLFIVQSRPITSLYPMPDKADMAPDAVLLSFGPWQGMMDPYTPLGQDMLRAAVVGFGRLFGLRLDIDAQEAVYVAGERLYVNLTKLLAVRPGRSFVKLFLESVDPAAARIIAALEEDGTLSAPGRLKTAAAVRLFSGIAPIAGRVVSFLAFPGRKRERMNSFLDREIEYARTCLSAGKGLAELASIARTCAESLPGRLAPYMLPGIIAGQVPLQVLLRSLPDDATRSLAMELTRALPHNVTTEMDLELWRCSAVIREDPPSRVFFEKSDDDALLDAHRSATMPAAAGDAIAAFLSRYGMRGIGEIDMGRPRWTDDPGQILQVIKSYLGIDPGNSPVAAFVRGAEASRDAEEKLVRILGSRRGGKGAVRRLRLAAGRLRELGGLRETPKFTIIRLFGAIRESIAAAAEAEVRSGTLERAEDAFFLRLDELRGFDRSKASHYKKIISGRRETYDRESGRRRVPRILLGDGSAFFEAPAKAGEAHDASILRGTPVSAGIAEGRARVVIDPRGLRLEPGEILVCPATDPAWTPLFFAAGGLVTEVGGMMTHGSVVAREYGIPAVVCVREATTRLRDGDRVRVDGSAGTVTILRAEGGANGNPRTEYPK